MKLKMLVDFIFMKKIKMKENNIREKTRDKINKVVDFWEVLNIDKRHILWDY